MQEYFTWLAMAGTAVFALSGALMALRQGMDVVGVSLIATVTGIGGGTLRDILLGNLPVNWVEAPLPIVVCIICAILACFFNQSLAGRRMTWLLYADAAGLALFAVLGARAADLAGAHPIVAILFGAMSASFGGILRDVICNEEPLLLKQEIYIIPAVIGAFLYIIIPTSYGSTNYSDELRTAIATIPTFMIRALAIKLNWSLNFPKARAPLDPDS
ncbi:MAG: trimeric intracellular cation channel family protein [Hyphomicrobiales bacterium]